MTLTPLFTISQTTLATQDFEGTTADTWTFQTTPASYNQSGDVWSQVDALGGIVPNSGTNFWGMQDLENTNGGGDFEHRLDFENVNVSGQTNILVSFQYFTVGFDAGDTIEVEFFFDEISKGRQALTKDTSNAWTLFTRVIPDGTIQVRFSIITKQNGASDRAAIDNILLQSGANTTPTLTIDSPTNGSTIYAGSAGFDVSFTTTNFTISGDNGIGESDFTGDGFFRYTIDNGGYLGHFSTEPIHLSGLSPGLHSINIELIDNDGNPLTPAVVAPTTFTLINSIVSLPHTEVFDYSPGQTLGAQNYWNNNNSGDEVLVTNDNLFYQGLTDNAVGAISFEGSGMDPSIEFTPVTSGSAYVSFLFRVTDLSGFTNTDGGYFAALGSGLDARLWIKPGTTGFNVGISSDGTTAQYTSTEFLVNTDIFVVFNYDIKLGSINLWANPILGDAQPLATLSDTDTTPRSSIDQFLFRQDSSTRTPPIIIDALRIGTNWAEVTHSSLSLKSLNVQEVVIFPNPLKNEVLNIVMFQGVPISVSIFDSFGKEIRKQQVQGNQVYLSDLKPGIYFLSFVNNGKTVTKKLVIQ